MLQQVAQAQRFQDAARGVSAKVNAGFPFPISDGIGMQPGQISKGAAGQAARLARAFQFATRHAWLRRHRRHLAALYRLRCFASQNERMKYYTR
jgi:hypothetical protein